MSCCVIALALVYQLIAAVRRVRAFFGLGLAAAEVAGHTRLRRRCAAALGRPWVRVVLVGALAVEGAAAGTLAYEHRFHLQNEIASLVFTTTGLARSLCGIE